MCVHACMHVYVCRGAAAAKHSSLGLGAKLER